MDEDIQWMRLFPQIKNFYAQCFASLSASAFVSNFKVAKESGVPSFAPTNIFNCPNGYSFGSNLIITREKFVNKPHIDNDHTGFAMGILGLVNRDTGNLYQASRSKPHVKISKA